MKPPRHSLSPLLPKILAAGAVLALSLFPPALAAKPAANPVVTPLHQASTVWEQGSPDYTVFKVPTLVTDRAGKVLIAIAEGRVDSRADDAQIHLVQRRSLDAGKTWSDLSVIYRSGTRTVGNPAPVLDRETGVIWLFFCIDSTEVWVTSTADAGVTWSPPKELTSSLKRPEHTRFYATGPGHGIQLERGAKKGRLLIPAYANQAAVPPHTAGSKSFVIYSDDHGQTWAAGEVTRESVPGGPDGNECMATELGDGRVYLTIRNNLTAGGRGFAISDNGGNSWSTVKIEPGLPEAVCQGSVIGHSHGEETPVHFYAAPATSAKHRRDKSARRDLTLWLSRDDCLHWQKQILLWPGPSAYSDMAILADGTLCVIFEAGAKRYDDKIVLSAFKINVPRP